MAMKLSLTQQIAEIDRELKFRERVYKRMVAQRELRQSEADYHVESLEAARETLAWLKGNERLIRQRMAQ